MIILEILILMILMAFQIGYAIEYLKKEKYFKFGVHLVVSIMTLLCLIRICFLGF